VFRQYVRYFQHFVQGLATDWIGAVGIILTSTAFVLFILMELLRLVGAVTNAYVGLVTYMALPGLFILGLILIPVGWARYRRRTGRTTRQLLEERFVFDLLEPRLTGSRLLGIISVLTLVNLLFLGVGGARMLHFMDTPVFCGTACHSVMNPEWSVYQASPHARVACVECHVGEGVDALIDAKLNGLWQIISATFDLYERPIPTPVRNLRPARETCEHCHWPEKFYGDRISVATRYALDSASTPSFTTLSLKIGSGTGERRGEIHWHIAAHNQVRYTSVEDEREVMIWVESQRPDGSWYRWNNRSLAAGRVPGLDGSGAGGAAEAPPVGGIRVLDCVDCHNRATHIYEDPETAVDHRLATGEIDAGLPFVKKVAFEALSTRYRDIPTAMAGIERVVQLTYAQRIPGGATADARSIEQLIKTLQEVYERNVHPNMRVWWNPYPDHIGHRGGTGCFRCHSLDLVDAEGDSIVHDCTLCHAILAWDSPRAYAFLEPPEEDDPEREMHSWLRTEFLGER
jgi:hypothetical protein